MGLWKKVKANLKKIDRSLIKSGKEVEMAIKTCGFELNERRRKK